MLQNPWRTRIGGYDGPPLDEVGLTPGLASLVERKIGAGFRTGFGYGSCAVIGDRTIVKIAPFPVHRDRFDHERAVSGIELPGVRVPRILDEGVTDDYEWIEIDRIPGRPMYEVWSDVSVAARRHATSHLAECVTAIQEFEPNASYLWAKFDRWDEHVQAAVDRSLSRAQGIVPDGMIAEARDFARDNTAHLQELPRVTCHGDLWFGNLLADSNGRLVGIIDWDRLAVAPPDYEIDMIWRFWRYPWDFVPGDFAATYEDELDPSLLNDVLEASSGGLSPGRIAARLGLLELAYRMGVTARFGWSEKHRRMLDTVLSGRWTERLFEH